MSVTLTMPVVSCVSTRLGHIDVSVLWGMSSDQMDMDVKLKVG